MSFAVAFLRLPLLVCRRTFVFAAIAVVFGEARLLRAPEASVVTTSDVHGPFANNVNSPSNEVVLDSLDDEGDVTYPCEDGCAGSFTYKVDRPVKVVLWTSNVLFFKQYIGRHAPNCSVVRAYRGEDSDDDDDDGDPKVVQDTSYDISDVDVVVFNVAVLEQHPSMPRSKPGGQLWVAGCWEPQEFGEHDGGRQEGDEHTIDCSLLGDADFMTRMDATATYSLDSTFPALFTPPTEEQMRRPAPAFGSGPVAASTVSDCRAAGRNEWLSATASSLARAGLSAVLSGDAPHTEQASAVSFYGACLHNQEEPECPKGDRAAVRMGKKDDLQDVFIKRANRCSARPFALVAENSQTPGYVTEKIWNALASGSVPVYWGPPEAKYLVPKGSSLFASDYASEEELAQAMLDFDEVAHRRARKFKSLPVQRWGNWTTARRLSRSTLLPRLCEAAASRAAVR